MKKHKSDEDDFFDEDEPKAKKMKKHKSDEDESKAKKTKRHTNSEDEPKPKKKTHGTISFTEGYFFGKGITLVGNPKKGFVIDETGKVSGRAVDIDCEIEDLPKGDWTIIKSKDGSYGLCRSDKVN
jgi:hypothetical protein